MQPSQSYLDLGYEEVKHYHSPEDRGFMSILYATGEVWTDKNGKLYRPKKQKSFLIGDLKRFSREFSGSEDVWVGQNEFRRPNRQLTNLLRLCTSFVDIDFYNVATLVHLTPDQVTQRIFSVLYDARLPPPNIVVESGRGLQIKWTYKEKIPAQALPRWKAVQAHLVELLSNLGADPNSQDGSRVLRLVGTFNSFNRTMVQVLRLDPNPVDFDQFADAVLPYTRSELADLRQDRGEKIKELRKQEKREKKPQQLALISDNPEAWQLKRKGIGSLNWCRFQDLLKLCRIRGGVKDGQRTQMLIYLLNFMLLSGKANYHGGLVEEMREMVFAIDPSWNFDESRLTTLLRKAEARNRGETVSFKGEQWTPLYTPKTQTLIDCFKITADEERQLHTIISKSEIASRHREREESRRRAAGAIPRDQYESNSVSRQKPWDSEGISRSTYYRRQKPLKGVVRQVRAVN